MGLRNYLARKTMNYLMESLKKVNWQPILKALRQTGVATLTVVITSALTLLADPEFINKIWKDIHIGIFPLAGILNMIFAALLDWWRHRNDPPKS